MPEILTKVISSTAGLIQENKVIKGENSILKERLMKLEYHSCHINLLFNCSLESQNEMDRGCYEVIRKDVSNLYMDGDNVNKGNSLTKFEKASKIHIAQIHQHDTIFQGEIIL